MITYPNNHRLILHSEPVGKIIQSEISRNADLIQPKLGKVLWDACNGATAWPLTILGDAGTGKTCAALCVLDRVYGPRRYTTTAELVFDLNLLRRSDNPSRERGFWEHWRGCDLTVLDEIGARGEVTDSHYEILKLAIDRRQDQPAIFLSNHTIGQLADIYDDRIASRLQSGTVFDMAGWPDRRVALQTKQCPKIRQRAKKRGG